MERGRINARGALRLAVAAAAASSLGLPSAAIGRSAFVRAGAARFEVLTVTLIRAEYAQDRRFEDRPTMTAVRRALAVPRFTARTSGGWVVIRTKRLTLRYRLGSGPFAQDNLRLTITRRAGTLAVRPTPGRESANLGGWRRALDLLDGPVRLNGGLLSRGGWFVLDDSRTVLLAHGAPGFTIRPPHRGAYQDWYVFGYGQDYARALGDLRALSGPAPLLPRSAFGVWFSRYWPYSEQDYHGLLGQFRAHGVPLDTVSIDTDFKRESDPAGAAVAAIVAGAPGRPYSWDGWEWDKQLFPDPVRFIEWAHRQGVSLTVNIHPSISSHDPQWPAVQAQSGGLRTSNGQCRILIADPTAACGVFDWASARELGAYLTLHEGFERQGVDFFWLDWCCDDSSAVAPGLTADTWINSRYAQRERARGLRWPAFARVGASYVASAPDDGDGQTGGAGIFAEHRYTMQFTGDTCATWPMLAFEAQFTASEGNVGLPYVSHDIGSFNGIPRAGQCSAQTGLLGEHLPDDLYARWVQFGTFQPLDRLHSNHGDRLPWQYGAAADRAATDALRLREALVPYIYTLARRAYDSGLPIAGALYVQWPSVAGAYEQPDEYTFGPDIVVAPVSAGGDPAAATVWIPPGVWIDYFTGQRFAGPRTVTLAVALDQMPVLVRAGSIIPTQPYAPFTPPAPPRALIITAFPAGAGSFRLYDDAGVGFGYERGRDAWTEISQVRRGRLTALRIGAMRGSFPGAPRARSWTVRLLGVRRPRAVEVGGRHVRSWSYDAASHALTIPTRSIPTSRAVTITAQ
jgi:hypothetical protein